MAATITQFRVIVGVFRVCVLVCFELCFLIALDFVLGVRSAVFSTVSCFFFLKCILPCQFVSGFGFNSDDF